ncbi:long-chain-acyl-CoA dehydrogenase, partial [Rhizoctonia solani]
MGVVVGTLSIATPFIVGASVPGFAPWVLAIVCYVVAGIQLFGFIGVFKEKAGLFHKYVMVNSVVVMGAFGVAAAFIAISGTRHNTATDRCQATFFSGNSTASASASSDTGEGRQVCDVFTWVILGLMAGLWVTLAFFQAYLLMVTRFYSQSQRADHKKYYSIYSQIDIPLNDRNNDNDAWNARPSTDSWHAGAAMGANEAQHRRQHSAAAYDEKYDSEPSYGVKRQDSDRYFAEPHRPIGNEQPYQYRQ